MENLKRAITMLPSQTEKVVDSNAQIILDLNREDQLYAKGIDATGDRLKEYAFFTIQIKQLLRQPFDRTTLFYSGKFYEGFRYKFDKNSYTLTIFSVDQKTPLLIAKYGSDIFGLTNANRLYLDEKIIKPNIDKWLQSIL